MKGRDRDQDPMSNVLAIYSKHLSRDLPRISARYFSLLCTYLTSQDQQRPDTWPQPGLQRRHVQLYPHQEGGGRHHPLRRGAHVDILPVHDQRGPTEDPHCDADHHLQEDLRQHGHPVEVSVRR